MRLRDRHPRVDGDVQFGVQAMPEPARAHLRDLFHLGYMPGDMSDLIDDVRFRAIEHSDEDGFSLWSTMPKRPQPGQAVASLVASCSWGFLMCRIPTAERC
jgi:hypothetical protein